MLETTVGIVVTFILLLLAIIGFFLVKELRKVEKIEDIIPIVEKQSLQFEKFVDRIICLEKKIALLDQKCDAYFKLSDRLRDDCDELARKIG